MGSEDPAIAWYILPCLETLPVVFFGLCILVKSMKSIPKPTKAKDLQYIRFQERSRVEGSSQILPLSFKVIISSLKPVILRTQRAQTSIYIS